MVQRIKAITCYYTPYDNRKYIDWYMACIHACMISEHNINFVFSFLFQAVIDANIFPALIEILRQAEFKTRKEAAWAITNATSGGSHDQIR